MSYLSILSNHVVENTEEFSLKYREASPFPHIVIDNFLNLETLSFLNDHFPKMSEMPNVFREPMSFKGQLSDIDGKWPKFSAVFNELQSQEFRDIVSKISNIEGLLGNRPLEPKVREVEFFPMEEVLYEEIKIQR